MMVTNTDLNVMDNRWRDKRDEILIKNDDENFVTVDKMMSDDEKSVVKGIEKSGTDIKDLCTHNRQGYCSIHKIKGDRKETKVKFWKKKKFGYGYVKSKKIIYTCPLTTQSEDNNNYTGHETSVSSTALMTGGDLSSGLDNFQRDNSGGIRGDFPGLDSLKGKGLD